MYLKLSNGNLLNLDLVTDVIFNEMTETATLQGYGINLHQSGDAYRYFKNLPAEQFVFVPPPPPPK